MSNKIKFLTTVWGSSYIDDFLNISLPSYMAPGNIPALAELFNIEFVILTSKKDIEYFKSLQRIKQLENQFSIIYIPIDDLITKGQYGVTLTAAYSRGIMSYGQEMLECYFLFMNSDFVLAEDSLSFIIDFLKKDRSVIVAPSLRASSENVINELKKYLKDESLSISKRNLVSIAIANLHPTVIAKTVNQNFCYMSNPNQYYWLIDEDTLLARFFLIFMLCIKPEKIFTGANSYCDYGFIPDMCPSGDIVIIQNSDDFFMMELQERDAEINDIHYGAQSINSIRKSLSIWTTKEHRKFSDHNIIFHKKDLPVSTQNYYKKASDYIFELKKKLTKPLSYNHHPYWESGVFYWKYLRSNDDMSIEAEELIIKKDSAFKNWFINTIEKLSPKLIGKKPNYNKIHPDWLDYYFLQKAFDEYNTDINQCLNIGNKTLIETFLGSKTKEQYYQVSTDEFILSTNDYLDSKKCKFKNYIFILSGNETKKLSDIFDKLELNSNKKIKVKIIVYDMFGNLLNYVSLNNDLMYHIQRKLISRYTDIKIEYVGGINKRVIRILYNKCMRLSTRYGLISMILMSPFVLMIFILAYVNNTMFPLIKNKSFLKFTSIESITIE